MDDMTTKNRIADAMQEPPVPESLLERTVVLARTVKAGREAEKTLAQANETLTPEEKEQLAAQSLVGRLMRHSLPPEGVSAEKLTEELLGREEFRKAVEKPADALLSELKSGKLILTLGAKGHTGTEKKATEKTLGGKQTPVKEAPEIKGPGL